MPNITLSIDEELLKASRAYARERGASLNALVRSLLAREVRAEDRSWLLELADEMRRSTGDSSGRSWNREELYDV